MKIALITGGSRGLGRSMALHLAAKGHDVILTYHTQADHATNTVLQIIAMGRKAKALKLDVINTAGFSDFAHDVKATLADHWQRDDLDFLINNAGHGEYATFADTTEAQFDGLMNTHFKGVFFLTQTMLPLIASGGRIVNISSGLTRFSFPGYMAYASMKGAVEVMTRYLAKELGPRGIAVNTIAPGAIETDFGGGAVRDNPQVNKMLTDMTALGRVGLPDDIGGIVAALLSDDSRWVTGQRIEVSGGMLL